MMLHYNRTDGATLKIVTLFDDDGRLKTMPLVLLRHNLIAKSLLINNL